MTEDIVLRGTEAALHSSRAKKILAVGQLVNVPISVEILPLEELSQLQSNGPTGTPPPKDLVLSIGSDCLVTMSNSMLRSVASMASPTNSTPMLLGCNSVDAAQVHGWLSFVWHSVDLPLQVWRDAVAASNDTLVRVESIQGKLNAALATIESHLTQHKYLVGQSVTLADISLAVSLKCSGSHQLLGERPVLTEWLTNVSKECQLLDEVK